MAVDTTVREEDLVPVRSRISWGAIVAGSVLALALYFLLTLLGGAIGLSVSDRVSGEGLATGAAVYAILVTALCLFVGGCVASQLTVGENKTEAMMYGLLVWAIVFALLLWLLASGVRAGFNTMIGVATAGRVAADDTTAQDWEAAARRAGVPQERIDEFRRTLKDAPADARRAATSEENRQAAADHATRAGWLSFAGTLVSMLAAVGGGYVGAGRTWRLFGERGAGHARAPENVVTHR